ncbi:MAG: cell division protein FtsQ/DivIB [Gammaproteobacteria bacterium]|nr:cell division protein FtsQ/DivIB [Gammaproteobacteria bacterium]
MTNSKTVKLIVWVLLVLLLAIALLWGWCWLQDPQNFPLNRVQIEASYQHINPESIQKAIAADIKGGFFSVNVATIKQDVLALPWVYAVNIKRVWPDKIVIVVTEQKAIAHWNQDSLINAAADVFAPENSSFSAADKLPWLSGPNDQAIQVLACYKNINQFLAAIDFNVTQVSLDARGSWYIRLNNGIVVLLGNNNIMNRLQRFVTVYPKIIGNRGDRVIRVDLRYGNGLAIKWRHHP